MGFKILHDTNAPLLIGDGGYLLWQPESGTYIPFSGVMNLFIGGQGEEVSASIPLFICNEFVENSIELFIKGLGNTPGAVPLSKTLNLVIKCPVSNAIDLYISGKDSSISNEINLFINGANTLSNNLDLVMPNVHDNIINSIDLYIHGF